MVVRQLRTCKVEMVEKDWLLDSICCQQIKPVSGHTLPCLDHSLLARAGYQPPS